MKRAIPSFTLQVGVSAVRHKKLSNLNVPTAGGLNQRRVDRARVPEIGIGAIDQSPLCFRHVTLSGRLIELGARASGE
jgi:hypothetical protein